MEEKKDEEVAKAEAVLILDVPEPGKEMDTTANINPADTTISNPAPTPAAEPVVATSVAVPTNPVAERAPVTEAPVTEDKKADKKNKPQKEKKKMDRNTLLCWIGIGICSVFIVLPPFFRMVFKGPEIIEAPKTKSITTLFCAKSDREETHILKREITAIYENAAFIELKMGYAIVEVSDSEPPTISEITLDEITAFKKLIGNDVKFAETATSYTFTFDYKNGNFSNVDELSEHGRIAAVAIQAYQSLGFRCETATETIDL